MNNGFPCKQATENLTEYYGTLLQPCKQAANTRITVQVRRLLSTFVTGVFLDSLATANEHASVMPRINASCISVDSRSTTAYVFRYEMACTAFRA